MGFFDRPATKGNMNGNAGYRDRVRGSLLGGAAGDALGYPVEFLPEITIFSRYGNGGITQYELTNGVAQISDDTQMTLFTAEGILRGTRSRTLSLPQHVHNAYRDWLITQGIYPADREPTVSRAPGQGVRDLLSVSGLFSPRAPGNTCISALRGRGNTLSEDYIHSPFNNSKGCGGIMRMAPVGLLCGPGDAAWMDMEEVDRLAAQAAAITHGHSLGYMSAAVAAHVIGRCAADPSRMSLEDIVLEARDTVKHLFRDDENIDELTRIIDRAMELSVNDRDDLGNIHALGEGWTGEETMGIALYCALRYRNDFSKAIIAAVNHKGDSDSTGAVTGNIVGALTGYDAIADKWKKDLELKDLILEYADALADAVHAETESGSKGGNVSMNARYTFFWKEDEANGEFSNWYRRVFVIDDLNICSWSSI